jgi:hypothetical protein
VINEVHFCGSRSSVRFTTFAECACCGLDSLVSGFSSLVDIGSPQYMPALLANLETGLVPSVYSIRPSSPYLAAVTTGASSLDDKDVANFEAALVGARAGGAALTAAHPPLDVPANL